MRPIVGSEAIASGALARGELRWNYTAVHPDVYLHKSASRNWHTELEAAWLWTGRRGIVAGRTAASLLGASINEGSYPAEFIAGPHRRRPGVVIRQEKLADDEVRQHGPYPVTSPARTAFDLARHLPRQESVAYLDALAAATGICSADVDAIAGRYPGARGMQRAREAIWLMDGGARSPEETALRLMLTDAGLPRPRTDIRLEDNSWGSSMAMGWDGPKVGVDYVADAQATVQNIAAAELFARRGWLHLRVLPEQMTARMAVVHRVRTAFRQRGVIC